ncbi:MAG: zinc ribbon domain-containing protein [Chlamydiae bacterium]|nr:zinc ribbon domain-containing protein [Chlamydiota bacterium]MBI3265485.1 zinc ribbon domain-containing protein [Chlamydiota bacterium]
MNFLKRFFLLSLLFSIMSTSLVFSGEELRRCVNEKCGQYAVSETWAYCPYCGTRLPELEKKEMDFSGESIVLGNVYKNKTYQFQIEKPTEAWSFLTDEALNEFNKEATVAMRSENVYSMVIVDKMPNVSLKDYEEIVSPDLEGLEKVYEQETEVSGQKGLKIKWSGKFHKLPLYYYYTLVESGNLKFQIIAWCYSGNDTDQTQAEVLGIENSFKILTPEESSKGEK